MLKPEITNNRKQWIIIALLISYNYSVAQNYFKKANIDSLANIITNQFDTQYLYVGSDVWHTNNSIDKSIGVYKNKNITYGLSTKFKLLNIIDSYIFDDSTMLSRNNIALDSVNFLYDLEIFENFPDSISYKGKKYAILQDKINESIKINMIVKNAVDIFNVYFQYWFLIYRTYGIEYCKKKRISCIPSIYSWTN
jgi:hypothetical protein